MKIEDLQSIFWDFDGVILDSTHIKNAAFKKLFQSFGSEMVERVLTHHIEHGGISRVEKIDTYYREFLSDPLTQHALDEKCQIFSDLVVDEVVKSREIPGAVPFIRKYHQTINMTVVSGTPEDELRKIVGQRGLTDYFIDVTGSPVRKPEHVMKMIESKGYDKSACLFIGDAMTDYNTAVETGIHFIGVQGALDFPEGTIVIPDCESLERAIEGL